MDKHIVVGVHLTDRLRQAGKVQEVLTEYGCHIKTRLGLHEVEKVCSPSGIIILEIYGDESVCEEFCDKLNAIDGVETKCMVFADKQATV